MGLQFCICCVYNVKLNELNTKVKGKDAVVHKL